MRTCLSRFALVGIACAMALSAGPAAAAVEIVRIEYKADASGQCVESFEVRPEDLDISSLMHKLANRRVLWSPVPETMADKLDGVTWSITEDKKGGATASENVTCTGLLTQVSSGLSCTPSLKWYTFYGFWQYKVTATKTGCQDIVVDPAIIFRPGGFMPWFSPLPLILGVILVVILMVILKLRAKGRA